jgi:flagellin
MSQTINTNLVSLNAQRNLSMSQSSLSTSMQRLSSGLRVNSAKDDAAGLSIAERMSSQIRGMTVAVRNANDAISLTQTGEGALGKVGDILQRMRELAVQSANGTNTISDRGSLNQEYIQLAQEATRTLAGTQFNGQNILANPNTSGQTFQIGANNVASVDQITVASFDWAGTSQTNIQAVLGSVVLSGTDVGSYDTTGYTAGTATDATPPATALITDAASAKTAIDNIDKAIGAINNQRATFGAVQNRFDNVVSTLQVAAENQTAAKSRIMDADYASETSNLSRANILQQAGNAMVAQANQLPQQVLALLR